MLRTFLTHKIRKQTELSERLWNFSPREGDRAGQVIKVTVPSCWETYPGFENYRAEAEYTTEFEAEGNVRLEFKGVSHMAWVYVDGREVAKHYNAYTPFDVVVKDLKPGIHILKVVVDNSFKEDYALNRPNDYMSYGGISRGVALEEIGDIYLEGIHVTPIETGDNGWLAKVEIFVNNITDEVQVTDLEVVLHNTGFVKSGLCVAPGKSMLFSEEVFFEGVKTWSMEEPNLYEISAKLIKNGEAIDDLIDRTGFRKVEVTKDRILINGRAIRIKGFCRHEDHPQYGCALPLEAMAYDLNLIKDMGGNSVRTSHYPNDERFLDLCDELGILVWEEHHLRAGDDDLCDNPNFERQCEQVIEEMITYHYNHPSIYIWGIMNEFASDSPKARPCYAAQYALIRKLDSTRPCSSASCKFKKDICMDLPDVVSWNIYPYWYEDITAAEKIDGLYTWTRDEGNGGDKPFLITEIGAGAIYGFRSHDHDKWTEEYQAETLEKQLTEVMAYTPCMGLYIWQFCDIRVNREWFMSRPRTRNNKGIVDEFRRRKLSYDVVKRLFTECPNYWD